jgi:hypothetical protein
MHNLLTEEVYQKWSPVLEHKDIPGISDPWKRRTVAQCLHNTEIELTNEAINNNPGLRHMLAENPLAQNYMGAAGAGSNNTTGNIDIFDPILINLVRRGVPNLMAYDVAGVQPMTGPTGLIFAIRSRYASQTGAEAFFNEVNTQFSSVTGGANTMGDKHVGSLPGNNTVTANLAEQGLYNFGGAMSTAQAEALGTDSNTAWPEMAFSIEKVTVTAKSRALAAEYTMEIAQDLKAVHGLDAEAELANILSTEIMAEINREVIRTILVSAKAGSQKDVTNLGFFDLDVDSNGRWSVEKFKGLIFHIEREANAIAKATRRGKANLMICSSDVASALNAAGKLSLPDLGNALQVDDTGNTFAGVLNGRIKVYIDPYVAGGNYMVLGYKGSTPYDAGLFYCPYVPLQQVRAVWPGNFGPRIGFKTRYGMVANPFAGGYDNGAGLGAITKDSNVYYARTIVQNIM